MSGQQHAPAALYPRKRTGTHFIGSRVGPRSGLEGGKSRLHRESIPDRPARSSVAITTTLTGPHLRQKVSIWNACRKGNCLQRLCRLYLFIYWMYSTTSTTTTLINYHHFHHIKAIPHTARDVCTTNSTCRYNFSTSISSLRSINHKLHTPKYFIFS